MKITNFKLLALVCLLLFSAVALAQDETGASDVEEVEVQAEGDEQPPEDDGGGIPEGDPSAEPIPEENPGEAGELARLVTVGRRFQVG